MSLFKRIIALLLLMGVPVGGMEINPGRTMIRLIPGGKIQGSLTAKNDTADRLSVMLSTKDWFVLDSNKAKNIRIDQWLKLHGKNQFLLKPGESREVKFTATCPKDAEGELVGMVSFTHVKDVGTMMTPMISVSVYVEAIGTEKIAGEIDELAVNLWQGKVQAAVSAKSTGNVHLRPSGTIRIETAKGVEIGSFPLKEGGPAYPGRNQVYFAQVPEDLKLAAGPYSVSADLEYRGLRLTSRRGFKVSRDHQIVMDRK